MPSHKKNHSVPQFMLEYWVDKSTLHNGVHVYEVKSQRSYISTGQGKSPFSFAITKDLYVNTSKGIRAVGLEKWFSDQESSLASLVRQVHDKKPIKKCTSYDFNKIIMALIGLECRSSYNITKVQEAIEKSNFVRAIITANPERPPEQLVRENIVHWVSDQVASLIPTEMRFFFAPENQSWLICDRPYFKYPGIEHRFVVLTNKVLLGYRQGNDSEYIYPDAKYPYVKNDFFDMVNKQIALNAREWLVATTPAELNRYIGLFQSEEWKQGVSSERITWSPVHNLTSGWTIDR